MQGGHCLPGGRQQTPLPLTSQHPWRPRFLRDRDLPFPVEVGRSAQQPTLPELGPRGAGVRGAHLPLRLRDPRPFPGRVLSPRGGRTLTGSSGRGGAGGHWRGLGQGEATRRGVAGRNVGRACPAGFLWEPRGGGGGGLASCARRHLVHTGSGFSGPSIPGRVRSVLLRARPRCRNGRAPEPLLVCEVGVGGGRGAQPREAGLDSSRTRQRGIRKSA